MVGLLKNSLFEWTIKLVENSKYTSSNFLSLLRAQNKGLGLLHRCYYLGVRIIISAMQANTFHASQVCLVKELQLKFSVNITAVSCPVTCVWYTSSMSDKIPIKYF